MKVLEIKNSLVKISYEPEDNLAIAGFIVIEDSVNAYVGQIMNIKADIMGSTAIVKLLFTFNDEGILKNYNGTIPSLKANVSTLPAKELLDVINKDNPIFFGNLAQQDTALNIDKSILENNLLVCCNNFENMAFFIENIAQQLEEKTIVIDTDGFLENDNRLILGRDFKLPLNYQTINYIYENDLDDIDAVSKAVIQEIFLEVQQYTKTLPERFIPFTTFYNVVDAQYKETQIPQLVLLKNKLTKYKEAGIFAEELKDILNLIISVEKNSHIVIDISNINESLQKELITYVHEGINTIGDTIYCFVKVNNQNSDKKLLKSLITNSNVFTTIICQHEYKYLVELKEISQNIILFAPLTLQHDFASYNSYLNKLNPDEFIIYGAHTQNIPFIVEFAEVPQVVNEEAEGTIEEEIVATEEVQTETVEYEVEPTEYDENLEVEKDIEVEPIETEVIEESSNLDDEVVLEDEINYSTTPVEEPTESYTIDELQTQNTYEPVQNILEYSDEIEADYLDTTEQYIEEEITPEYLDNEALVEQVAKDVDKVFYEKLPQEDEIIEEELLNDDYIEEAVTDEVIEDEIAEDVLVEDELTEDDLNLIDDISAEDLEVPEEEYYEEEQPPIVPIYPAEDLDGSDTPIFENGDRVSVAKFGEGVVERMINYGNKTLCSIDFPNIGRRLLDPAVTEIIKLS